MKLFGCIFLMVLLTTSFSVRSAFACPMPERGEFDNPDRNDVLGIVAEVVSYDLKITQEAVCQKTLYKIQEVVIGEASGLLTTEVCYANSEEYRDTGEIDGQIEEMSEYDRAVGNYPGAIVAAMLTKQTEPGSLVPEILSQTKYRPAITSCWFAHQANIGELPEEQRIELLSEFRAGVEESFSVESTPNFAD